MKAIITKYHGPTNTRGSRYSASDRDGNRAMVPARYATDDNHARAVRALCAKMGWSGKLIPGGLGKEIAWVFLPTDLEIATGSRGPSSDILDLEGANYEDQAGD